FVSSPHMNVGAFTTEDFVSRSGEEYAVNTKIKELETQLASYQDKMRVLDKRRAEICEQIWFHFEEGLKEMFMENIFYSHRKLRLAHEKPGPLFHRIQQEGIVFYGRDVLHQEL
ncbi:MAG: hypothetical protein ACE5PV_24315, partial [Candidatus Poribacteria bacterium]